MVPLVPSARGGKLPVWFVRMLTRLIEYELTVIALSDHSYSCAAHMRTRVGSINLPSPSDLRLPAVSQRCVLRTFEASKSTKMIENRKQWDAVKETVCRASDSIEQ
jgi:hypothetical protein